MSDTPDVFELTDDDVQRAVENAAAMAGCTVAELRAQAEAGRFRSDRARRAWFVVHALDPEHGGQR